MPPGRDRFSDAAMTPEQLDKIFSRVSSGLGEKKRHDLDELIDESKSKSRGNSRATTPSEIYRPQPSFEVTELRDSVSRLQSELEEEKAAHAMTSADLDIALQTTQMLENDLAEAHHREAELSTATATQQQQQSPAAAAADANLTLLQQANTELQTHLAELEAEMSRLRSEHEEETLAVAQQCQAELLSVEKQHYAELEQQEWERGHLSNEIRQLNADLDLSIQASDAAHEEAASLRAQLRKYSIDGKSSSETSAVLEEELKESRGSVQRLKEATKVDKAELSAALGEVTLHES